MPLGSWAELFSPNSMRLNQIRKYTFKTQQLSRRFVLKEVFYVSESLLSHMLRKIPTPVPTLGNILVLHKQVEQQGFFS